MDLPRLKEAQITFDTTDSGKNDDTKVTVTVATSNGTTAARIADDFGQFGQNSQNGPYSFPVVNKDIEKNDLTTGNVMLHIDAASFNIWKFNFFLELFFSDGSKLTSGATNIELSQQNQQQEFGIS